MSSENADYGRLYDVPLFDGQDDYLPDAGLERIQSQVLDYLPPDGFEVTSTNATRRGVTATIHFDHTADPIKNAELFEAMMNAVTLVRTLHANLVAAREVLSHIHGGQA